MTEEDSTRAPSDSFPTQARVVIIGGGVIGCSVAYHLTKLGWTDVMLLERKQLTAGTTWHAAGLVEAGGFYNETILEMAKYTLELYRNLEEETGQSTGFKAVGYLEIACTPSRLEGLRRIADFNRVFDVNVEEIPPSEIKKMWPLMETDDILAGFYTAGDGRVNPIDTTMALAKGARLGGARIIEETKVTGISQQDGRVTGVITPKGEIRAEYVVNCAGMWARELGKLAGVHVPLQAAEHYYLITEAIEGIHPESPVFSDLDRYAYYREEVGGVLLGFFEPVAAPWGMDGIPKDFAFGEIQPNWERMTPYIEEAMKRVPALETAGIHKFFCGPESFTPDLMPLMGETPELQNFFVAAGFNSLGILLGGGVGQVLAHWMVEGLPDVDVTEIDIQRMSPYQNNRKYLRDRTVEILGLTMAEDWPNYQYKTARNARKSALHDRLAAAGAYFAEFSGWEYPDWFAPEGVEPRVEYSWGRQNWFEYSAAEHKEARQGVVLMDVSLMSKLLVQGRDAERVLNRICANNVAVPVGRIVYTQWLNGLGTIEADVTVTRLAEDSFLVVLSPSIQTHVEAWLKRYIPSEAHVFVTDVTSGYAILNVQGPKSRRLLSGLTNMDMSNEAFPYLTMQEIDIGYALVKALRVSYVGELGWELYVPTEFALHVYDMIVEAGEAVGLKHAGLQALDTLRLERSYRDYGNDIDNRDTPLEAGLGFFVDFDKPGGFIGREALLRQKEEGLKQRFVQFLLQDPGPLLHGGEPIYRNGACVGYIRAGGYGHTLGGAVGLGFVENEAGVTPDYVKSGSYEIEVAGVCYPATVSLRPMYDPKNQRVRS
ncbi:MAG: FAD-dependent oxidoreductase [Anaerolineae bacterium]|jgi:glycine cleavage system aminomethyltransferase T/glycine/D-amino acid oxidase-like deaminating enzyme